MTEHPNTHPLESVTKLDWWKTAIANLGDLHLMYGANARTQAAAFGETYYDRIPAMVVDVVTSRQRSYDNRVLPLVQRFEQTPGADSLTALAYHGSNLPGLRTGEDQTIRMVADGLLRCGNHTSDRHALDSWCAQTVGLELAHNLDPYVGAVHGIGPALFAYLRMRAGADTIKVDVRVKNALRELGFQLPQNDTSVYLLAQLAARQTSQRLIELDQLLWFK